MAGKLINIRANAKKKLTVVQKYQKALQDKKRIPLILEKGDKVWVSTRNMKSRRPNKKLDWKWLGPGIVEECIGEPPTAYRIKLESLGDVHPVFHPSLLEPYEPRGSLPHEQGPITDTMRQYGDDVYEVEEIREKRKNTDNQWEYLIKWARYSEEENSWEPGASISPTALKEYWKRFKYKPRRSTVDLPTMKRGRGRPRKGGT